MPTEENNPTLSPSLSITVFGASGRTGREVVQRALEAGHRVLAFVRDPCRLKMRHPNLSVRAGDVFDPEAVAQSVWGQDAVICTLGSRADLKVRSLGTQHIVEAMQTQGVSRLVVLSRCGCYGSLRALPPLQRLLYRTLLRGVRLEHEAQEAAVTASDLDWTVVRPGRLTNAAPSGSYQVTRGSMERVGEMARGDVADFLLKGVTAKGVSGEVLTLAPAAPQARWERRTQT